MWLRLWLWAGRHAAGCLAAGHADDWADTLQQARKGQLPVRTHDPADALALREAAYHLLGTA